MFDTIWNLLQRLVKLSFTGENDDFIEEILVRIRGELVNNIMQISWKHEWVWRWFRNSLELEIILRILIIQHLPQDIVQDCGIGLREDVKICVQERVNENRVSGLEPLGTVTLLLLFYLLLQNIVVVDHFGINKKVHVCIQKCVWQIVLWV